MKEILIAKLDGKSKGTAHSVGLAEKQNKKVYIYKFTPPIKIG
jgi:hypothetical protein